MIDVVDYVSEVGENTEVQKPGRTNHRNIPSNSSGCPVCGWYTLDYFQEFFYARCLDIIESVQVTELFRTAHEESVV